MSALLPSRQVLPTPTMLWTSPESGLWVANSGGEYAGLVEFRDGHFIARNRTGDTIGLFSDIPSAKAAVTATAEEKRTLLTMMSASHLGNHEKSAAASNRLTKHYRRSV